MPGHFDVPVTLCRELGVNVLSSTPQTLPQPLSINYVSEGFPAGGPVRNGVNVLSKHPGMSCFGRQ